MNKSYGISIKNANEEVFASGLFSCVEYCRCDFRVDRAYEDTLDDVPKLIELSNKYNVAIRSYHLPFNDEGKIPFLPSSLDSTDRTKTLEMTKNLITALEPTGIEYVVIHGSLRVLAHERQQRLNAFVEYLKELCDFCKGLNNIKVCVETLKPRCIGNGLKEHLYILENVNKDNLGICFDSNHLLEEDNLDFIRGAGEYIYTTHFSDFDGIDERHWYPGRGINDWKSIVDLLEKKGYNGPYVFEVGFPDGKPSLAEYRTLISEWEQIFN
ncbi:MAG: sugar phosphate isomerase/epimerase [Clostridia bacterium]|nr:sugar phosphate isomerase/epimerase [Clostridia bacterium]